MNDQNNPTTFTEAKAALKQDDMTLTRRNGEYCVDFAKGTPGHKSGPEGSSYHTDDLGDAVRTGRDMRGREKSRDLKAAAEKSRASVADRAERKPPAPTGTLRFAR